MPILGATTEIESNFDSNSTTTSKPKASKLDHDSFTKIFDKANSQQKTANLLSQNNNAVSTNQKNITKHNIKNKNDSQSTQNTQHTKSNQKEIDPDKKKSEDSDNSQNSNDSDEKNNDQNSSQNKNSADANINLNNLAPIILNVSPIQNIVNTNQSINAYQKSSKTKKLNGQSESSQNTTNNTQSNNSSDIITATSDKISNFKVTSKHQSENNQASTQNSQSNEKTNSQTSIIDPKSKQIGQNILLEQSSTQDSQTGVIDPKAQQADQNTLLMAVDPAIDNSTQAVTSKHNLSAKTSEILAKNKDDTPIITKLEIQQSNDKNQSGQKDANSNNAEANINSLLEANSASTSGSIDNNTPLSFDKIIEAKQANDDFTNSILDQVNKDLTTNFNKDNSQITIALNPENLGQVEITLKSENGAITAQITAQDSQVKDALSKGLEGLKQNLSDQGVNVDNLIVQVKDSAASNNNNQQHQNLNQDSYKFSQSNSDSSGSNSQSNQQTTSNSNYLGYTGDENIPEDINQEISIPQEETTNNVVTGKVDYRA